MIAYITFIHKPLIKIIRSRIVLSSGLPWSGWSRVRMHVNGGLTWSSLVNWSRVSKRNTVRLGDHGAMKNTENTEKYEEDCKWRVALVRLIKSKQTQHTRFEGLPS